MPTRLNPDDKPVVQFDAQLEISPFALFRRLKNGEPLALYDARRSPGPLTFAESEPWPGESWSPAEDGRLTVLFDDDGSEAYPLGQELASAGWENVRVLFGGLELYRFALDPEVVGAETFLVGMMDTER